MPERFEHRYVALDIRTWRVAAVCACGRSFPRFTVARSLADLRCHVAVWNNPEAAKGSGADRAGSTPRRAGHARRVPFLRRRGRLHHAGPPPGRRDGAAGCGQRGA